MIAALLAGCALQSPPQPNEIQKEALGDMAVSNPWKAAATSSAAVQDNWLATFEDSQLDALAAEGVAKNPDLRVAATRVEQAAGYVNGAKAALRPTVGIVGTGGIKVSDLSSALTGIVGLVSWELDLWGRLRYGEQAAQASYAATQADFEFARQSLAATIARSWFTATETLLQEQISEEMVQAAKELATLATERQRVGVGNEQDVALARANLGTQLDNLSQARFAHGQSVRALELLLGRYPAAELKARLDLAKLPSAAPAGLPLEMLERRPDLIAAERRVAAAFNRAGEARTAQLPRVSLTGNIGYISSDILELKQDYENPTAGVGAKLQAPIYTGGGLEAQVEIRTAEQKEAVAQYARTALRAIGDVENALAAAQALAERETLLQQVVAENRRALTLTQSAYRVGRLDLRSVEQQQLSVHAARIALLRVQSEQLTQRVNLHLALGGSFEMRRPAPPK
jgi:multidrug efflux system outer membrane protein